MDRMLDSRRDGALGQVSPCAGAQHFRALCRGLIVLLALVVPVGLTFTGISAKDRRSACARPSDGASVPRALSGGVITRSSTGDRDVAFPLPNAGASDSRPPASPVGRDLRSL